MHAWLFESSGHSPMLRFEDGSTGIPVNLHLYTRYEFMNLLGRRLEIGTQLSQQHYTVRLPDPEHKAQA
jgi:hypothetical protein